MCSSDLNGLIRAALEAGTLEIAEPRAVFEERMKNRGFRLVEFADAGEVRALLARSGLAVVGDEISMGRGALAGTNAFERDRVLAVLGVPD